MKMPKRRILILGMTVAWALGAVAQDDVDAISKYLSPPDFTALKITSPTLSELRIGERATISIVTTGCFGGNASELVFYGPTPLQVVVRGRNDKASADDLPVLGKTEVSATDAERLDRLIAYYRSGPKGFCTSNSTIRIRWSTAETQRAESFFDASCAAEGNDAVLTLWSVVNRVTKEP